RRGERRRDRRRCAYERHRHGEDHRQLLALLDDAVRFHPARDAVPAAQDAHQRRGLRAYRLSPRAQQADRRERGDECPDAAEGEDAEPGRVHSALSRQAITMTPSVEGSRWHHLGGFTNKMEPLVVFVVVIGDRTVVGAISMTLSAPVTTGGAV